jgi:hypothetical protein
MNIGYARVLILWWRSVVAGARRCAISRSAKCECLNVIDELVGSRCSSLFLLRPEGSGRFEFQKIAGYCR